MTFDPTSLLPARFWEKVDKNGPTPISCPQLGPCWQWTASTNPKGYGKISFGGRTEVAHRLAYADRFGKLPSHVELDHLCKNRRCVNPAHHEPVDRVENNARSTSPSALNAQKTVCVNGHAYDAENTLVVVEGGRERRRCRACDRERRRTA